MSKRYVQTNTFYLAGSGVIVGATSIVLTSFTDIYGNVLTMTDFGDTGYITLEPDTTNEEAATFTGVVANANNTYTLTGVKTNLAKSPYTETSGLVRAHSGGTKVVVTDNVAFWNTFGNKSNTGIWTAVQTFATGATPVIADAPVNPTDASNKGYVDGVAVSGAPNADLVTKGIVEIATTAEIDAGTSTGGTGASVVARPDQLAASIYGTRLPSAAQKAGLASTTTPAAGNLYTTQKDLQIGAEIYAADSVGTDAYAITLSPAPAAYVTGMVFRFKAGTANTGAATLNVNGLGAKAIVKRYNVALATGDILAGQLVEVEYDSTGNNFQMLSPVAKAPPALGAPVARNWGTIYQAATDVFVTAFFTGDGGAGATVELLSDSAATPVTRVGFFKANGAGNCGTMAYAVRAGDYYKANTVTNSPSGTTVFEVPLS